MKKKITKTLKELYSEALICEMPVLNLTPYTENRLENQKQNITIAKDYINGGRGELIGNFQNINIYKQIYQIDKHGELISHILIDTKINEILGFINLIKIKDADNKGYFTTHGIFRTSRTNKGLIFEFFTKWLLPEYKIIISSNSTTISGSKFWIKIIEYGLTNNKECGIFKEKKFIQLYKIEDFSQAWDLQNGEHIRIYIIE